MGPYKVHYLMRKQGLEPVWKKQFMNTTDSKHDQPVAENLLDWKFNPVRPNQT